MKLFVSFYLILVGLVFGCYALAAGKAPETFVSGLIALVGALFLSTTEPTKTR